MLFRRRRADPRRDAWSGFATALELEDAAPAAERMRRWLDFEGAELDPVYALRRDGQPALYLFDVTRERTGPAGRIKQHVAHCLLRADGAFAPLAFRAHPRRNEVMESLEASRTGSTRVGLGTDEDDPISVFAREPASASTLLTDAVRRLLERAIVERGAEGLVVGERHILAHLAPATATDGGASETERLEALASLTTDLLALYASLHATGHRV